MSTAVVNCLYSRKKTAIEKNSLVDSPIQLYSSAVKPVSISGAWKWRFLAAASDKLLTCRWRTSGATKIDYFKKQFRLSKKNNSSGVICIWWWEAYWHQKKWPTDAQIRKDSELKIMNYTEGISYETIHQNIQSRFFIISSGKDQLTRSNFEKAIILNEYCVTRKVSMNNRLITWV